ncbi:hypothetical protein T484DRAFT_1805249 [Baffinella frigidus]|nr:hypothetical protein T484DRAFT_1805249 [Cryptophyta sp. CCMP2293]
MNTLRYAPPPTKASSPFLHQLLPRNLLLPPSSSSSSVAVVVVVVEVVADLRLAGTSSCEHTMNTLRYANRVKQLKGANKNKAADNGYNAYQP